MLGTRAAEVEQHSKGSRSLASTRPSYHVKKHEPLTRQDNPELEAVETTGGEEQRERRMERLGPPFTTQSLVAGLLAELLHHEIKRTHAGPTLRYFKLCQRACRLSSVPLLHCSAPPWSAVLFVNDEPDSASSAPSHA